jgi:arylsulfatase A-like enzyme
MDRRAFIRTTTVSAAALAAQSYLPVLAAAAGVPAPEHLDGVDLMPYLRGERQGSPHEYLFWLNNQPGDPVHRHLVAVRWKQWRLYRHHETDPWQLFDLVKDPREEKDVAAKFPKVVEEMARKHAEWKTTHVPPPKSGDVKVRNPVPTGHGWFVSDGRWQHGNEVKHVDILP